MHFIHQIQFLATNYGYKLASVFLIAQQLHYYMSPKGSSDEVQVQSSSQFVLAEKKQSGGAFRQLQNVLLATSITLFLLTLLIRCLS